MSGDAEQEYFAEGIAEEITTALARLRTFFVIARASAFTFKGRLAAVQQVGRELGVRYVLEGSVRRSGDRLRVSVHLADAISGREVWAERYDKAVSDVFVLQDEIASSVVIAVEPKLYEVEGELLRQRAPGRVETWALVIRAMAYIRERTPADYEKALELLESAITLDPTYARAIGLHAFIRVWHAHSGWIAAGLDAVLPSAGTEARSAIRLDKDDPYGHLAMGVVHMVQREHTPSVEELREAVSLNPNLVVGYMFLGLALAYGGRGSEAVAEVQRAMRLSPRDPDFSLLAGARAFAHYIEGNYEAGLEWGRRATRLSPELAGHWRALALSAASLGLIDEARTAVANARTLQPDYSVAWVHRASPLVSAEDRDRYIGLLRPFGLPE